MKDLPIKYSYAISMTNIINFRKYLDIWGLTYRDFNILALNYKIFIIVYILDDVII